MLSFSDDLLMSSLVISSGTMNSAKTLPSSRRAEDERTDADRTGRLAKDGHLLGVTAKVTQIGGNVAAHHETKRSQAVVDRHHDDVSQSGQILPFHRTGAALKGAAVDEDHHRLFAVAARAVWLTIFIYENSFGFQKPLQVASKKRSTILKCFVSSDMYRVRNARFGELRPGVDDVLAQLVQIGVFLCFFHFEEVLQIGGVSHSHPAWSHRRLVLHQSVVVAHDLGDDEEGKDAALVAVSSVDEVEVLLEVTTLEGLLRLQRQQLVAPDGHEEGVGDEVVRRGGLQLLHVDLLDALHQLADVLLRAVDLGAEDGQGLHGEGARLQDAPLEEALLRQGAEDVRADAHGARRLAEEGHLAGVTAEEVDVLLDPLQREQLVVEALVRLQVGAHHEAQRAEAVVHGDENDVALRRQVLALHHPGAALKGAAVDEDHHRAFRRALLCRHPHVQNMRTVATYRVRVTKCSSTFKWYFPFFLITSKCLVISMYENMINSPYMSTN
ncbi:hypothetical protein TYRP_020136 [Tyrophagus putrescentiae]|nr:hypothetical protein TYRP_020136 [Tyrophagus putrescentiae]